MKITVNVREVEALADRLSAVKGDRLASVTTQVVNEAAVEFERKLIDGGVAGINLSKTYVKSKTDLALATVSARPRAEIVTRGDLTVMGRFGPSTVRAPGAPRRAGPIAGRRSAGVSVAIRTGTPIMEPQWFLMPLKNGNGFGAFVRDDSIAPSPTALREGRAGKRHVYGPSPYSLFARQIVVQGPRMRLDLEELAVSRLSAEIERTIL